MTYALTALNNPCAAPVVAELARDPLGGDFEATGIRQLDDERIVGVWAAE